MKRFIAVFLLAIFFAFPAHAAPSAYDRVISSGKIRCGYFTWPPYIVKDPNSGAISGINYDFMEEIGRLLDLKIEWAEEASAGTALTGLETNRYDVMCASLWPDAGRLKHAQLTAPEFYSTVYVASRADDNRFDNGQTNINDPGITIVGIEGDITASLATAKYPKAKLLALPQTADSAQLMQSVVSKKADLFLVDKGTVADFNRTNGNRLKIVPGLKFVQVFPETLAVKPDELALAAMLNQAMRIITDTGKAAELTAKYPAYGYHAPRAYWDGAP